MEKHHQLYEGVILLTDPKSGAQTKFRPVCVPLDYQIDYSSTKTSERRQRSYIGMIICLRLRDDMDYSSEKVKHLIGGGKMMVTIVWNLQRFHLIDALPKGQKFNASYYIVMNMQSVFENRPIGLGLGLAIHAHNAPHTDRKTLNFG
jgi:hypothetical protein